MTAERNNSPVIASKPRHASDNAQRLRRERRSRHCLRQTRCVCAGSEATKQSSFAEPTLAKRKSASAREQKAGLLRCARNDGGVLTTASNPVIACDKRAALALGAKQRSNPALRSRH